MAKVLHISPVTRVEGHLEVEVTVDAVDTVDQVVEAKIQSPMFRGFEKLMIGRDPRDAVHYTQRVCGVCPVSHAMAAAKTLENAFGAVPADNGRILRNLVLGANYIQSHILHFYHLAAPDYLSTEGLVDMSPWKPRFDAPDLIRGDTAATLVGHYVEALAVRRKAHQMGAVFGGRLPGLASFIPGGCTERVSFGGLADFEALLDEIRVFVDDVYLPDVTAVAGHFPEYAQLGRGPGNLLSYGVFDLDAAGGTKFFTPGRYENDTYLDFDAAQIKEYVAHSWFTPESGDLNPGDGVTEPQFGKEGAYSWVKSPRYENTVYEVGPLARMWINGDYREGISVVDRLAARALETKKVAEAMKGWLADLELGAPVYNDTTIPQQGSGIGLTEAPRGALGHWLEIEDQKLTRYQIITPTAWNASPLDDLEQPGPVEAALVGTPVRDMQNPVEILRVIHSVDPCLACAVHMVRPGRKKAEARIVVQPGV